MPISKPITVALHAQPPDCNCFFKTLLCVLIEGPSLTLVSCVAATREKERRNQSDRKESFAQYSLFTRSKQMSTGSLRSWQRGKGENSVAGRGVSVKSTDSAYTVVSGTRGLLQLTSKQKVTSGLERPVPSGMRKEQSPRSAGCVC